MLTEMRQKGEILMQGQIVINIGAMLRSQKGTGSRSQVEQRRLGMGTGMCVILVGSGGCFILMASDFLSEALSQRGGVKFRVGMGLDAGIRYENSHLRE